MAKLSRPISIGSILLLLTVVVALGYGLIRKNRLDASSRELAIDITQAALTGDGSLLIENAHPDFTRQMSAVSQAVYLQVIMRILGPLQRLESISGSSVAPLLFFSNTAPAAHYILDLVFEDERTQAIVSMRFEQERWQIIEFVLQSQRLLN